MFCPRCSTDNISDQKYCRQCGLSLAAVSLALEGRVDEAITKLHNAEQMLRGTLTAFGIFLLIALVTLAEKGKLGFFNFAASAVFGLTFTLPFLITIVVRFWLANRLLNAQDRSKRLASDQSKQSAVQLPATPTTDQPIGKSLIPISVTEHTTRDLKRSEERG